MQQLKEKRAIYVTCVRKSTITRIIRACKEERKERKNFNVLVQHYGRLVGHKQKHCQLAVVHSTAKVTE